MGRTATPSLSTRGRGRRGGAQRRAQGLLHELQCLSWAAALCNTNSGALTPQEQISLLDPGRCSATAHAACEANEMCSLLLTPVRRQSKPVWPGRQTQHTRADTAGAASPEGASSAGPHKASGALQAPTHWSVQPQSTRARRHRCSAPTDRQEHYPFPPPVSGVWAGSFPPLLVQRLFLTTLRSE